MRISDWSSDVCSSDLTRFPVLLERFAIRRGSGGEGAHRGGDGAERHIRFLEPMRAGILSNRRRVPPSGLAGGGAAKGGIKRGGAREGRGEGPTAHPTPQQAAGGKFGEDWKADGWEREGE